MERVGQVVRCSPDVGLVCRNRDQEGAFKMCLNYQVRVLCCEPREGCLLTSETPSRTSSATSLPTSEPTSRVLTVTTASSSAPPTPTCYCSASDRLYPAGGWRVWWSVRLSRAPLLLGPRGMGRASVSDWSGAVDVTGIHAIDVWWGGPCAADPSRCRAGSIIYQEADLSGHCYYAVCSLDCHVVRQTEPTCPTSPALPTPSTLTPGSSPSVPVPVTTQGCPSAVPPRTVTSPSCLLWGPQGISETPGSFQ